MKLAEALSLRAQLNNKISQLRSRLNDCIKIQEGDTPSESPEDVLKELDQTLSGFRRLVYLINMTNTKTVTEDNRNITSLLAERDALALRVRTLYDAIRTMTEKESRYSRSEIKYVRTMDVAELRKLHDNNVSELRKLDLEIQGLGFTTDLIEK